MGRSWAPGLNQGAPAPTDWLQEIAPLELLARLSPAAEESTDRETIYRAVLADYGFKRLTPGVTEILDRVWALRS